MALMRVNPSPRSPMFKSANNTSYDSRLIHARASATVAATATSNPFLLQNSRQGHPNSRFIIGEENPGFAFFHIDSRGCCGGAVLAAYRSKGRAAFANEPLKY